MTQPRRRGETRPIKSAAHRNRPSLIAQKVEKVSPDMVSREAHGYRTVDYMRLPLLLLQPVRESKAENEGLREHVRGQEGQIGALTCRVQELEKVQRQMATLEARLAQLQPWTAKPQPSSIKRTAPAKPAPGSVTLAKVQFWWNARVLLRELRERNDTGGYTILTDWLRPQRTSAHTVAVRRFETPAGKQAQVDWGHLGTIEWEGQERKHWGFTYTLGYSRRMMAEAAVDQKLGTLLRMHEEAFRQMGGIQKRFSVTA